MAERIQKRKKKPKRIEEEPQDSGTINHEKISKVSQDMDEILDEIDKVLEENAEEFVNSYRQYGGE